MRAAKLGESRCPLPDCVCLTETLSLWNDSLEVRPKDVYDKTTKWSFDVELEDRPHASPARAAACRCTSVSQSHARPTARNRAK